MLLVRRIDAVAPLARLAVEILPTGEGPAYKEVVFDEVERPLDARRTIGVADLVRRETESHTLCERRHLGHWFHLLAAATQHHHMRVVDHHSLWRAIEVAERLGEKDLAIEPLEGGLNLEEQHPRITQHRRCGLRFVLPSGHRYFMRRGVVLHLDAGFKLIAARGHDGLLPDALPAAERGQGLIRQCCAIGQ